MNRLLSLTLIAIVFTTLSVLAEEKSPTTEAQSATNATASAPIAAPTLYFGYNYYHFDMTGQSTATTNIYKFGASTVDLNMLSATWLYSPDWTFVALIPHLSNKVETIYEPTATGMNYKTTDKTSGLSDLRLMAVTPLSLVPAHMTMIDVGMTLPTGSIDKYFTSSPNQRAAYNMQMGSGTPDLVIGATLTNTKEQLVSTARGQVVVRGGRNANGYALGNEFLAKLSSIYNVNKHLSAGVIGNYKIRGAVLGKDEKYEIFNDYQDAAAGIQGDGHQFYHAAQATWDATLMAKLQTSSYKGMNAALEVGAPIAQGAQNKDDIRLDINFYAAATLNASF